MSDTIIRKAAVGDIDEVAAIYADAVQHGTASYELAPPGVAEMRARFDALVGGGFPYFVAEADGAISGYAYAGAFRPRPAYRFIVENSVYVAPLAKRRGLGRSLMERLVAEATALGFRQMIAVIGDGHAASASVRLHEKLGFVYSGRLIGSGFKHGKWLDTVFMQLAMNGGDSLPPDPESLPEKRFRAR